MSNFNYKKRLFPFSIYSISANAYPYGNNKINNSEWDLKKAFTEIEYYNNEIFSYYKNQYEQFHRDGDYAVWWYDGTKEWYQLGVRHRIDGPALIKPNGDHYYYINGKLCNIVGPAIELVDGHKEYWLEGKRHREDGPAIEYANTNRIYYVNEIRHCEGNNKYYYLNGVLHRENGPAIELSNGYKEYWKNGKRHREKNLPAVINEFGAKQYWLNGELHRENGPALMVTNEQDKDIPCYYYNGVEVDKEKLSLLRKINKLPHNKSNKNKKRINKI